MAVFPCRRESQQMLGPLSSWLYHIAVLRRVPASLFAAITGFGIALDRCRKLNWLFSTILPRDGCGSWVCEDI